MHREKIILFVHEYANFSAIIKDALQNLGFTVYELKIPNQKFKYSNLKDRIYNFIRKTLFKDYSYKDKLKQKISEQKIIDQLALIDQVDYALIIRADVLSIKTINIIKSKAKQTSAYQWDGLNRFPLIYETISLFDHFFVFDTQDLSTPFTRPITNFYFDHLDTSNLVSQNKAIFIGSYFENRNKVLQNIVTKLNTNGVDTQIKIYSDNKNEIQKIKKLNFEHLKSIMTYEENLQHIFSMDILIDVHVNEHNGLSFRFFEGLGFNKKVITTNQSVKHYDFYNKNNIFIWGEDKDSELIEFISSPYCPIPSEIKYKYSFENWIKYVLNLEKHIPITLQNTLPPGASINPK